MKKDVEIWRDIIGYENLYKVSNWGRVKLLNYRRTGKERILKPAKDKDGYLQVVLYKDGKGKHFSVHRLVAEAFIPNPDNLPCINHRDECPSNNFYGNLEWCTYQYNNTYGTRIERVTKTNTNGKCSKAIVAINPDTGEVVVEFPSTREAGRNGYDQGNVAACCRGERKTAYGYIWRYRQ